MKIHHDVGLWVVNGKHYGMIRALHATLPFLVLLVGDVLLSVNLLLVHGFHQTKAQPSTQLPKVSLLDPALMYLSAFRGLLVTFYRGTSFQEFLA